LRWVGVHIGI